MTNRFNNHLILLTEFYFLATRMQETARMRKNLTKEMGLTILYQNLNKNTLLG